MFFRSIAAVALVLVAAATMTTTIDTQTRNKRIVIVAGRPSHPPGMHEFRAGSLLLQKALAGVKGVTVDVIPMGWPKKTVDGKEVDDHAALDGADAVFIYADGGRNHPAIQNDRVQVIDALAAKGVGLAFGHYGVEVPVGEPAAAMHRWVGGYYETNFSANPMWAPNFQKFPSHPVTRGVGPFATHDEWYFNMRWPSVETLKGRITPILVATPSDEVRKGPYVHPKGPYDHVVADSGKAETMMWVTQRPDGGRGFGFTGGHTHANWGDANQRRIFLNALLWIAKVEVPKGGVPDGITAADLTMNLDDKPARR
jgi:type 1 glutamine amidotransferase